MFCQHQLNSRTAQTKIKMERKAVPYLISVSANYTEADASKPDANFNEKKMLPDELYYPSTGIQSSVERKAAPCFSSIFANCTEANTSNLTANF